MFQRFNTAKRTQTIFFVISKREAENLCSVLQGMCSTNTEVQPEDISFFHADIDKGERCDRMRGFLAKAVTVMVATTAFGTGNNYPNIKIIIHNTISQTLVESLQNIGRGGRDGAPYNCIMYYSYKNILECSCVWVQGAGFDSS
jgi:superfamily II DNA helicase RecQ